MRNFHVTYSYDIGKIVIVHVRPAALMYGLVRSVMFDVLSESRVDISYKIDLLYKNHKVVVPEADVYANWERAIEAAYSDALQAAAHDEIRAVDIHGNAL